MKASIKKVIFEYSFSGKIWKTDGKGGWYFITLPKSLSKKIRKAHKESDEDITMSEDGVASKQKLKLIKLLGKRQFGLIQKPTLFFFLLNLKSERKNLSTSIVNAKWI